MEKNMETFTPSESMLHQYVLQNLSTEDDERVELWLMNHPEIIEDLKLDLAFAQGVKAKAEHIKKPIRTSSDSNLFGWLLKPQIVVASIISLITATFIGFIIGASWKVDSYEPAATVNRLSLETTRSIQNETEKADIYFDSKPSIALLEISTTSFSNEYESYNISIHTNKVIYDLSPTETKNETLEIGLPSTISEAGEIRMILYGTSKEKSKTILKSYKINIIHK